MQDVIKLLPDSVANQIAAGEVVQRPSSVVKELMENAIDAGATKVQVVVADGGRTLIQVIDNGKGMSETDARLAFERHATSKINRAEDLFALHTMGFRGEALASIVAVAQVELITRRPDDELGTRIVMSGSVLEEQEPVMCPVGSNFKVKSLFYNIPARRKFLKSNQTELNNIVTEFERVALINCDVEFSLMHNDNELIRLPKSSFRQRIVNLFGKKINSNLIEIGVSSSLINIKGFVGAPESARKKGVQQYMFVNGRYMRHPYFAKAVSEAYSQIIPAGEQVPFFLCFDVAPSRIDVNIHPTKTEIKFEDEQSLWKIIAAAVRESLGRFNASSGFDFDAADIPEIPTLDFSSIDRATVSAPKINYNPDYNPFKKNAPEYRSSEKGWEKLYDGIKNDKPYAADETVLSVNDSMEESSVSYEQVFADELHSPAQYKGQYILVPVKSGLMWVHQRRAHVRVLFEEYMKLLNTECGNVQRLIFPERIELSAEESIAFEAVSEELNILGFEISSLGSGSYALTGVPVGIDGLEPAKLFTDIIRSMMDGTSSQRETLQERLALSLAKQVAIVGGQLLSAEEMSSLVGRLFATDSPARTPDGKIIIYIMTDADINRPFFR